MVALTNLAAAVGAIALLLCGDGAVATPGFRNPASPGYSSSNVCPERCRVSGPNTGNWSVYPNFNKIKRCPEAMFYDFSLYDEVDNRNHSHRINACSSFGPDFGILPTSDIPIIASSESHNVQFEVGWWKEGFGLAAPGIRSLVAQIRAYVANGHGAAERPFIIYGQSGVATVGLYIGQGLLNEGIGDSALKIFENNLESLNVSTPTIAMQLCGPEYDSTHIFGVMATSNSTFNSIQTAIKSWANATCLEFSGSTKFAGPVKFTTPLLHANQTSVMHNLTAKTRTLHARAECRTIQVEGGNLCPDLAKKCGISTADFMKYNPGSTFCNNLKAKQHVCCSSGDLPDFSPQPNADGSCHAYQVQGDDNCDNLAAEYSLTREELEDFNKNTWGWNGCHPLYKDTVMCLSEGTAPFPAPIANAICGPQKPGSKPPSDGSDIAKLNPCPLNACCNIWGQCGITKDFCIDTNTGPLELRRLIRTDVSPTADSTSLGALEADALQIDTSKYTHIHFGFGTLTSDYQVKVGDVLSTYQFGEFKKISGAKRILSFGGWEFSNSDATYKIFRTGVRPENRLVMARNIANFIKEHNLDGVDIDWEYPGAPDLPEYDPGTADEGPNYLAFLVILKNLLPGKSVSIAAPSSYWYLKQFPIKEMSRILDYIVYMTYDLHGQWDAHNSNSQEGCETGNCLRSQVNLTETKQSLAMITKAGVPGEKVVVGVTSYGRSFKMADPSCWGPDCQFTGDRLNSNAKHGKCTATARYLADAEIAEILADSSRIVRSFVDSTSNSDILVYDNDEWVGYMSAATKRARANLYSAWGLGGTSDWATDLQEYHPVPKPSLSWAGFVRLIELGENPKRDPTRIGNWTEFDCQHPMMTDKLTHTPPKRWREVNADGAWNDVVRIWKETDQPNNIDDFMLSVSDTLNVGDEAECGSTLDGTCTSVPTCASVFDAPTSGPAGQLIWNLLVDIHFLYKRYYDGLQTAATFLSLQMGDLQAKFAPFPEEDNDLWEDLLGDLLVLGGLGTAGPFLKKALTRLAWFNQDSTIDSAQVTVMTLLDQGITIGKQLMPGGSKATWTPEKMAEFSAYMAQVISGWQDFTAYALDHLLKSGSDEALDAIWDVISDGKLIEGAYENRPPPMGNSTIELKDDILKSVFGFTIPALWRAAGTHAFIISTATKCTEGENPDHYLEEMEQYLDADTMKATGECLFGYQWYLVYLDGKSKECHCQSNDGGPCNEVCDIPRKFSVPPGLDTLNGTNLGNITKSDLISGSIRTWHKNEGENTDKYAEPTHAETIADLMDVDVTTPGFMHIPISSPGRAYQSWDTTSAGSSTFYPCDIPPGLGYCGESTFVDQTSDASPNATHCRIIIKNIQGDAKTDFTHTVVNKPHHEILKHEECHFGIEAASVSGNVDFKVGGQDVIDIINNALEKFERDGRIGAKGFMNCNGNIKSQPVEWGIY